MRSAEGGRVLVPKFLRKPDPGGAALPPLRAMMRSRGFITVVVVLSALIHAAEAHPHLFPGYMCTAEHHPSVKKRGHGATSLDGSIGFSMSWSAPDGGSDPQPNENDPMRAIPEAWEIASDAFKPGARHTLTVVNPDVGELMVTTSFGTFVELAKKLDGQTQYGHGTECEGKRYNTEKFMKPNTRFIWVAPTDQELNGTSAVVFKVTAASGRSGAFRNNQATFLARADLQKPVPGAASATPPKGTHDTENVAHAPVSQYGLQKSVSAHGWCMTFAWAVFIPIGVWFARYAKPADGVGRLFGAGTELVDASRASQNAAPRFVPWIRSDGRWFMIHRALTYVGLVFALLGFVFIYALVDAEGGAHFESTHASFGVAALVLGGLQPLNAYLRPSVDASVGKTTGRVLWEILHRVSAIVGLLCSVFAVTSGMDRAQVWGESPDKAKKASNAYAAWLFFVCLATVGLEVARWRERKQGQGHKHQELKELEMEHPRSAYVVEEL